MTKHIAKDFYLTHSETVLAGPKIPESLCGQVRIFTAYWRDVTNEDGKTVTLVDGWYANPPTCEVCLILYMEAKQKACAGKGVIR